jgi:hypothetical protein
MMGISIAAGATAIWLVSVPAYQQLHHPRMDPTEAVTAETQGAQARFAQERNAEIDASIAAVEAQRTQARFAQERNAEIDAAIATIITPWLVSIASSQAGSPAHIDGPEQPWQP